MARRPMMNAVAITAAGTYLSGEASGLGDVSDIMLQASFDYGSGGTSVAAYVQTSLDAGATWIDIASFLFGTADLVKLASVSASGAMDKLVVPSDATLAANTTADGILGDIFRVKYVVTGTYVATTLSVWMQTKVGVGAPHSIITYPPDLRWIDGLVNGITTMTRPSDTTPYTAGDEISNDVDVADALPWVFPDVARVVGGRFIIRTIAIFASHNVTFSPALWLFTLAPAMVGDNVPYSHVAADDLKFIAGFGISMQSVTAVGSKSVSVLNPNTSHVCDPSTDSIYGVFTAPAYTPISAETFKVRMLVEN